MALRVLLADESSTIKKVIQLALQDFGVEVKSVPVGSEVENVARTFKPDLVFADVLLAKKNGYEIASSFKNHDDLKIIPVVLMWSGFVAFDESRYQSCQAEGKIEKPFDADTLRQIVKKLVPRLDSNQISPFLSYPNLPEFIEPPLQQPPPSVTSAQVLTVNPQEDKTLLSTLNSELPPPMDISIEINSLPNLSPINIDPLEPVDQFEESLLPPSTLTTQTDPLLSTEEHALEIEDIDEFQQISLAGKKPSPPSSSQSPHLKTGDTTIDKNLGLPDPFSLDVSDAIIATMDENNKEIRLIDINEDSPLPLHQQGQSEVFNKNSFHLKTLNTSSIDPIRLEELLREQVKEVLQEIAWKIVPDVAERVVREEMQKLMKEAERLP